VNHRSDGADRRGSPALVGRHGGFGHWSTSPSPVELSKSEHPMRMPIGGSSENRTRPNGLRVRCSALELTTRVILHCVGGTGIEPVSIGSKVRCATLAPTSHDRHFT
jgi:hypothetical protein